MLISAYHEEDAQNDADDADRSVDGGERVPVLAQGTRNAREDEAPERDRHPESDQDDVEDDRRGLQPAVRHLAAAPRHDNAGGEQNDHNS